jgi:hypothetical protein
MSCISIIDHDKIYKNVEKYGDLQLEQVYEKIKELIADLKTDPLKNIEEIQIYELLGLFHRLEHRALEYNKYGFKMRPFVWWLDEDQFRRDIRHPFHFLYSFLDPSYNCFNCIKNKQCSGHEWFINLKNKNENKIYYLERIEEDLEACITSARGYQRFLKDRGT